MDDTPLIRDALYAREVASAYYLHNPRVTLIDVGWKISDGVYTGDLAVRVHVRKKPVEAAFESLSLTNPNLVIDKTKIPFLVDIIEASYPLHQFWWTPAPADPRTLERDPLQGGISISGEWIFGSGTLGGIVEDRETHEKMILSNWHVLAGSDYAVQGTRIFQPGFGDYGTGANTVGSLERHSFAQGIDAAVARLNGARDWVNDQLDIGPVTGVKAPDLGMKVTKSGRSSGVTHGLIDGFEGEFPLTYQGLWHSIKYVYRIVPRPGYNEVSRPGDSGSWWLEEDTKKVVALHFAGQDEPEERALAIAMPQVLDSLNVDIVSTQMGVPELAAPSPAPQAAVQTLESVRG